jgi:hypothetical protein
VNVTEDRFEGRLLNELRAVVAANTAPVMTPAPVTRSRRRPIVVGSALAGVAATAAVVLVAGGPSAAYAVDSHADGSVTVTIKSLKDAPGLEHKLAAAGITAVVDYVPAGKTCQQPRYQPASPTAQKNINVTTDRTSATFSITKGQLTSNETLVIESSLGQSFVSIGLGVAEGSVAPCTLVDANVPSSGGGGTSTGGQP